MKHANKVKVWDIFIRAFHWILVLAFILTFVTEDDFMVLHVWAGYIILMVILLRILWGFIGTRHARFFNFVVSPKSVIRFLKDTLLLRARRYIGHNPAGGMMTVLLIVSLLITTITGIVVYGIEEQAGPLANKLAEYGNIFGDETDDIHEFFANFSLLLVVIHIGGVFVESILHRENLTRSMMNGYKRMQ